MFDEEIQDLDPKKSNLKKKLLEALINILDVEDEPKENEKMPQIADAIEEKIEPVDNTEEDEQETDELEIPTSAKARVSVYSVGNPISNATEKKIFKKLKA